MNTFDVTIKADGVEYEYVARARDAQAAVNAATGSHAALIGGDCQQLSVTMRAATAYTPVQPSTSASTASLSDDEIGNKWYSFASRGTTTHREDAIDLVRWAEAAMQATQGPARDYVPLTDDEIHDKSNELARRYTSRQQDAVDFARWIEARFTQGCATSTPQSAATPDVDNVPGWDWAQEHGFTSMLLWRLCALGIDTFWIETPGDMTQAADLLGLPRELVVDVCRYLQSRWIESLGGTPSDDDESEDQR